MNLLDNLYLRAFLSGVGLSFTPCVYPLIPIIVGYIGVTANTTKLRGFILSFSYVSGVAVTYSVLGLFASLTGKIFGQVLSHPIIYILAGIAIIIFGLSLLDVFVLSLPNLVKLPSIKKKDFLSAFFLGLVSGLMVSPCVTPMLGSILLYLATKKNILYGVTLLFTFAYGMGLVLIFAGTFSSILVRLPKSGKWSVYIKKLAALMLIGMGIYFLYNGIRRI